MTLRPRSAAGFSATFLAWVNMTSRIMKYASIKGSRLFAQGAELPPGKHALRVSINDAQNRLTQATVSFTVQK